MQSLPGVQGIQLMAISDIGYLKRLIAESSLRTLTTNQPLVNSYLYCAARFMQDSSFLTTVALTVLCLYFALIFVLCFLK